MKSFLIVFVMLASVGMMGCSTTKVTSETFSFTPKEEKELVTKTSDYLTLKIYILIKIPLKLHLLNQVLNGKFTMIVVKKQKILKMFKP